LRRREFTISNVIRYSFNLAALFISLWFAAEIVEVVYGCKNHAWLVESVEDWDWWKGVFLWILTNWGAELIPTAGVSLIRINFRANKVEYLASRNKFLEEKFDAHRDSSRVKRNGATQEGDK